MNKIAHLTAVVSFGIALMWAQTAKGPAFDVASLKPDHTSSVESGSFEHGKLEIHYATLRHLIASAYNTRIDLVEGGPGWIDVDRFEILAKTPPETKDNDWRLMLQNLLIDRFDLQAGRADILRDVFVLTSSKEGPKLTKSGDDSSARVGCWGNAPLVCHKVTLQSLADQLRRYNATPRPVVDETGVEGFYDFKLFFDTRPLSPDAQSSDPSDVKTPVQSIFQSLREYGLRLEPAKRPINGVVIDHVERKALPN